MRVRKRDDKSERNKRTGSSRVVILHWANQPCKVTAPEESDVIVVSGNPLAIQGLPGEVLNNEASSVVFKAPSRSYHARLFSPTLTFEVSTVNQTREERTNLIKTLEDISKELISHAR